MEPSQNIDKLKIVKRNINRTKVLDTQSIFPSMKNILIGSFCCDRDKKTVITTVSIEETVIGFH